MSRSEWPEWAPTDVVEWLEKMNGKLPDWLRILHHNLITDFRMREVWKWYDTARCSVKKHRPVTSTTLCLNIERAMRMPGKPGNLPPKERRNYMSKVRNHAYALISLLNDTRFDRAYIGEVVDPDNLASVVLRQLTPHGHNDPGHVVAYMVNGDGVHELSWDYPDSNLVEHLISLFEWTYLDDYLGPSPLESSAPIAHARSHNTRAIYFNCTLYSALDRDGIVVPFPILATIANVALDMPTEELLDEDTVRKQVRRYERRIKKKVESEPN